jgi:hypothetical protein
MSQRLRKHGTVVLVAALVGGAGLLLTLCATGGAYLAYLRWRGEPTSVSGPTTAAEAMRARLIGTWELTTPEGSTATLEFLPDGVLHVTSARPGHQRVQFTGRWEILGGSGDRMRIRRVAGPAGAHDDNIRFQGDDQFVIEGPQAGAVYRRRR